MPLLYALLSTLFISLLSFVGLLFISSKKDFVHRIVLLLISLSAGTLMGGAFLHLLPEASEVIEAEALSMTILLSFVGFYIVERVLHWRHCHDEDCEVHSFGYMNLVGDGLHNFIDGLVIGSAFLVDVNLGLATSLAIIFHEIPQEIGDYGVLIKAGFKRSKALMFNFLTALTAMFGALVSFTLADYASGIETYMLPLAAGGFIYIAASDLLPEIRKETKLSKVALSLVVFLSGILLMYFLTFLE